MANITKMLNTRVALKIDTLEAWNGSTLPLLKGELAIATVAATAGNGLTEPVCMIKIGEDGVKTFSQLPWNFYAKASDVLAACKSEDALKAFVNGVIADAGIASSGDVEELAGRVTKLEGDENTDGSVAKAIKDAIDALDLANTYAAKEHEHTKADITDFAHTHEISEVNGLQDALDGKQAAGDYAAEVHTHTKEDITDFAHTHTKSEITDFAHTHTVAEISDFDEKVKAYDYATKSEAQGYADAKDDAIAEAKKAGDDAQDAIDAYIESNDAALAGVKTTAEQGVADAAKVAGDLATHATEADGKFETKTDAAQKLADAKKYTDEEIAKIPAQTDYTVTITETTDGLASDIAKKYTFTQNGSEIGSINLAKELVVTSGSVKAVTEADKPYSGAIVGDKYIELVIANQDAPIYVPAKDLVDIYTAKDGAAEVQVAISNTNEISATLTDAVKEKLNKAHTHTFTDADVEDAISKEHTHNFADEAALNGITAAKVADWDDAVAKEHTHTFADTDVEDAIAKKHAHTFVEAELNKIVDGDVAKWNAAEAKAHEHGNKTVLDGITGEKVTAWDAAEQNAKDYADDQIEALALGTMSKETADDYVKKADATGYDDILTKTEAQGAYQAKGEYYTKTEADATFTDSTEVDAQIDAKITALDLANTYQAKGDYATAEQGAKADTALQAITTTENGGLKVTNNNQIDIDDTVIFILDCGTSSSNISTFTLENNEAGGQTANIG